MIFVRRMCTWEIRKFTDYRIFAGGESSENHHIHLNLLLQVNNDGEATESFRLILDGHPLIADVWAKDIFEAEELKDVRLRLEIEARDLDFRSNTFTTKWEDVEEMLGRGTLTASKGGQDDDITIDVRKTLDALKGSEKSTGASLRWSIQARGDSAVQVILQALPLPASRIRKDARLTEDECLTIVVESLPTKTTFDNSTTHRGPKPILFARDPVLVKRILSEHPEKLTPGNRKRLQ